MPYILCDFCEGEYWIQDNQLVRSKRHYCSKGCYSEHQKITGAGELHSQWQGGITPKHTAIRNSPEYAEWRFNVFQRDDFICQKCGERGGALQAHHILGFSEYPNERLIVGNGSTLCKDCHRAFHSLYGIRKHKSEDYFKWSKVVV